MYNIIKRKEKGMDPTTTGGYSFLSHACDLCPKKPINLY